MKLFAGLNFPGQPRRDRRLTAINFIADAVNRTLDLKEIADNAVHAILAVMYLDAGGIYIWQAREGELRLFAHRGASQPFARLISRIRKGDDATVDAVLNGTAKVIANLDAAPRLFRVDVARAGFRSAVLYPIRAQGVVVGMLALGSYKVRKFGGADIELMEVIANQLGHALVRAQLQMDLQHKNQLLELLIEEAHHRIKNNLQMVSGLLQLQAESSRDSRVAGDLQHAITRIQAIAQVHHLLSQDMAEKVDTHALITTIVQTVLASASGPHGSPQVALELEHLCLEADQAVALALIVNELVANSILHGQPPAGQALRIQIRWKKIATDAQLRLSDNGGGFSTGQDWQDCAGQGMKIVAQLAQVNLRGRLQISTRDQGVRAALDFTVKT